MFREDGKELVRNSKSKLEVYVAEVHAAVTDSTVESMSREKRKEEAEKPIYFRRI
jgi:hypothetical protein